MSSQTIPVQSLSTSIEREHLAISESSAPERSLALVPRPAAPVEHVEVCCEVDQEGSPDDWFMSIECSCGSHISGSGADCKRVVRDLFEDHVKHAVAPAAAEVTVEEPYNDGEFRMFADFLAREMEYNLLAASDMPVRWYREQVGLELCSIQRGAALRMLVMDRCRQKFCEKWRVPYEGSRPLSDLNRIDMGIAPPCFLGLTRGEWIMIAICITAGVIAWRVMPW